MANGHGGYRRPSNPAPVSGPGKLARRTDGGPTQMDLPNADYGENKTFREAQSGASLRPPTGGGGMAAGGGMPSFTGLAEPSSMPDTPVTDGAASGPGAGLSALGIIIDPNRADAQHLSRYLPALINIANHDDTPPSTRRWVRSIIANL